MQKGAETGWYRNRSGFAAFPCLMAAHIRAALGPLRVRDGEGELGLKSFGGKPTGGRYTDD